MLTSLLFLAGIAIGYWLKTDFGRDRTALVALRAVAKTLSQHRAAQWTEPLLDIVGEAIRELEEVEA